ncbi:MAG: winged helix-turn-helix domain-containing protein [Candidatus Methanomethylicia archaeon]|nr:winged helix-turn-helix domain-containing protein [Candidatus Methanomethylicia archaeon]
MEWLKILPWKEKIEIMGTKKWILDYYYEGPPPIVIELLNKKKEFYEKIVKLLDLQKTLYAKTILFLKKPIDLELIDLATSFSIYIVKDDDGVIKVINGEDIYEINNNTKKNIKSKIIAKECRNSILEIIKDECLTTNEIIDKLKLRFNEKTIRSQIRKLLSKGEIVKLYRLNNGKLVFGIPNKIYPLRENVSKSSRSKYLKNIILSILENRSLTPSEIANIIKVDKSIIIPILRELRKEGKIKRIKNEWMLIIQEDKVDFP